MAPWILSGTTRVSQYQKCKTNLDLLEQEIVNCSGISWAICKSTPRPRQITMPASHHSVFYRPDALPAAQPTASKHWRQGPMQEEIWKFWEGTFAGPLQSIGTVWCGWTCVCMIASTHLHCSPSHHCMVVEWIASTRDDRTCKVDLDCYLCGCVAIGNAACCQISSLTLIILILCYCNSGSWRWCCIGDSRLHVFCSIPGNSSR